MHETEKVESAPSPFAQSLVIATGKTAEADQLRFSLGKRNE
jgi:hypothetical protein